MLTTMMAKVHVAQEEKRARRHTSGYWCYCASCGKSVVKKEYVRRGCFVCGFHGESPSSGDDGSVSLSYKVHCPRCHRIVVREALDRTGCYLCGFKI